MLVENQKNIKHVYNNSIHVELNFESKGRELNFILFVDIFEESKCIVNKLVLTRVNCEIDGDVFYPQIDLSNWKKLSTKSFGKDVENEYDFKIETYIRS